MNEGEPIPNKEAISDKWKRKIEETPKSELSAGDLFKLAHDINFLETGVDPDTKPGNFFNTDYTTVEGLSCSVGYQANPIVEPPVFGSQKGGKAVFVDDMGKSLEILEIINPTITTYRTTSGGVPINLSVQDRKFWAEDVWRMLEQRHKEVTP